MRPVIVVVSFGVSAPEAREKSLAPIVREIEAAFPEFSVAEAYTSAFIRRRLQKAGADMPSLAERLARLLQEGVREVYIQPTLLTPGEEYENKILKEAQAFSSRFDVLEVGEPVFFREGGTEGDDVARGLTAIFPDIAPQADEALVLLGHGSPHRHNPVYVRLQRCADEKGLPVHIGVLEEADVPNFAMVQKRLERSGKRRVLLAPLLLAGGRHVTHDLAGEEPGSWKSRLQKAGFSVRLDRRTLGERAAFRRIYVEKVRRLVCHN